jgi:hypothetical protein
VIRVETHFGPVAAETTDAIEVGRAYVADPDGDGIHDLVLCVQVGSAGRVGMATLAAGMTASPADWTTDWTTDWASGDTMLEVTATLYDSEGGRAIHHWGQVVHGGLLVELLRAIHDQELPDDHTFPDVFTAVTDWTIDNGLLDEDLYLTDAGKELLATLDYVYPEGDDWFWRLPREASVPL